MSLYSANGQSRTTSNSLIANTTPPNVGQFGWTSTDLASVVDIVKWVDTAQNAAVSASASADYAEAVHKDITQIRTDMISLKSGMETDIAAANLSFNQKIAQVDSQIKTIKDIQTEMEGFKNYFELRGNWIKQMYDNIQTMYLELQKKWPDLPDPPNYPEEPDDPTKP